MLNNPTTRASVLAQRLASSLQAARIEPVHPDVLVAPICPISIALREDQEGRISKRKREPGLYHPPSGTATQT